MFSSMKQFIFLFSILILAVTAYDENTLVEDVKKKATEALDQLPDNLKNALPPGISPENMPSVDEGEELLKKRCDKYGTNESFDNAMAAKEDLQFCVKKLINYTQITEEIEKAKPTGDLDTVFRSYCKKTPAMRQCVSNFTDSIEPCLSPSEKGSKVTILNITEALINFICFKEGDRIALFISEKGPECLKSKQEDIQNCLNSTFSKYVPSDTTSITPAEMPLFLITEKECNDVTTLQLCIVSHLETCSEPTPANIVDSMFTYVRKYTTCQQYVKTSGANLATISTLTLVGSTLALLRNQLF